MNRILIGILATLVFLCPGIARAQGTQAKYDNVTNVTNVTDRQAGMYEDIEVMRRLMNEKLGGFSAAATIRGLVLSDVTCAKCHSPVYHGVGMVDLDRDGRLDVLLPNQNVIADPGSIMNPDGTPKTDYLAPYRVNTDYIYDLSRFNINLRHRGNAPYLIPDPNQPGALAHYEAGVHRALIAVGAASFDTEGIYLKGHGIVYTLTLPPTARDPRPQAPNPPPKPLTDWDRIRREVRQEKPAAPEANKQTKEPTLGDLVLKLLADNGKHFSQLKPEESLTVAITFRAPRAVQITDGTPILLDSYLRPHQGAGTELAVQQSAQKSEGKNDTSKQSNPKTSPASTLQDYMLLADLHMKQNKAEEAINAYLKALEMKPDSKEQVTILQQLQRAYRQAKKEPEARLTEQKLKEYMSKMEEAQIKQWMQQLTQDAKPTPLPGKLVISATKKQLDDVGSGKMSFEDFKKAASVEFVTFPAEKK
jgi:tetratricopeptide (TPR) repeat protein